MRTWELPLPQEQQSDLPFDAEEFRAELARLPETQTTESVVAGEIGREESKAASATVDAPEVTDGTEKDS